MAIKFIPHDYFDAEAFKPVYGINVIVGGKEMRACANGKPLLFDTPEDRDAVIRRREERTNA